MACQLASLRPSCPLGPATLLTTLLATSSPHPSEAIQQAAQQLQQRLDMDMDMDSNAGAGPSHALPAAHKALGDLRYVTR